MNAKESIGNHKNLRGTSVTNLTLLQVGAHELRHSYIGKQERIGKKINLSGSLVSVQLQ